MAVSPVYLESLKSYERFAASDTLFARALAAVHAPEGDAGDTLEAVKQRVLKVTKPPSTALLEISATLGDPKKAQALAQYVAEQTVELNRSLDTQATADLTNEFRTQLNAAKDRYRAAQQARNTFAEAEPVDSLQDEVENTSDLKFRLERDLAVARTDLADYMAQRQELPAGKQNQDDDDWLRRQIASTQAKMADLEGQARELGTTLAKTGRQLEEGKARRAGLENEVRITSDWGSGRPRNTRMNGNALLLGCPRRTTADCRSGYYSAEAELTQYAVECRGRAAAFSYRLDCMARVLFQPRPVAQCSSGADIQPAPGPMTSVSRLRLEGRERAPFIIGIWAAGIALAPGIAIKALIAAPAVAGAIVWWSVLAADRWLALFFFSAILLPPLPAPFGNAGVHIAPVFALLGMFAGLLRMPEWRLWRGSLPLLFCLFLAVLTESTALAALYSGWSIALGSMARTALFGIGVYVFLYTYSGPREKRMDPLRFAAFLFFAGAAGALFACLDFYFQLPAPAGYGAQFIWVDQDVLRRAQGLFYEASTLGNFCSFFLVMILVSFFRPRAERPCSRLALGVCGALFGAALIFSYSRSSLAALGVAVCAFLYIRRVRIGRGAALSLAASLAVAAMLARIVLPTLASHYWTRLAISLEFLALTPNTVLSGRLDSWTAIADFILQHPWDTLFGIGYKTLPYTDYVRAGLIADNTYLSLLVETGIVGLCVFAALNAAILRVALRASRSAGARASFFGSWIFCFWCGELVQMLSGDLITFWRVLPVYFWVLATAARESGE